MILTDQEIEKLEKSLMDALMFLRSKKRNAKALSEQASCEELIDWMVRNYEIDGMVTRQFIDEYYRLCEERGIKNTFHDNTISNQVKKYGFSIVSKKVAGTTWRVFVEDETRVEP